MRITKNGSVHPNLRVAVPLENGTEEELASCCGHCLSFRFDLLVAMAVF